MKLEDIKKRDTVFINATRKGVPVKIGTVLSLNKKKQTVFVAYRRATFGNLYEERGYFKPEEIVGVAL